MSSWCLPITPAHTVFPSHSLADTQPQKADLMSLKGSPAVFRESDWLLLVGVCIRGQPELDRSAVGPLTRLLLPPWFQDDVAPVGGMVVWYKRDVESSKQRRWPDRERWTISFTISLPKQFALHTSTRRRYKQRLVAPLILFFLLCVMMVGL